MDTCALLCQRDVMSGFDGARVAGAVTHLCLIGHSIWCFHDTGMIRVLKGDATELGLSIVEQHRMWPQDCCVSDLSLAGTRLWLAYSDGTVSVCDVETRSVLTRWSAHYSGGGRDGASLTVRTLAVGDEMWSVPERRGPIHAWSSSYPSVKDEMIKREMQKHSAEYTIQHQCRVFCGTYNVAEKKAADNLGEWWEMPDQQLPEVMFINLQEVDMSSKAFALGETAKAVKWVKDLTQRLPKYQLVANKQLMGLVVALFVREDMCPHLSCVTILSEGCGIMGKGANKGAIAVRMRLHETTMCLIGCHFAAHQSHVMQRNQDFHTLCERIRFGGEEEAFPDGATVFDCDYLVWIGDMNYRIDLPGDEVRAKIAARDMEPLKEADQLMAQMKLGNVFVGFNEGELDFLPTYKLDKGTLETYDSSEKQRIPARPAGMPRLAPGNAHSLTPRVNPGPLHRCGTVTF